MIMRNLAILGATGCGIGYLPAAGTIASFMTLLLILLLGSSIVPLVFTALVVFGIPLMYDALPHFTDTDPREIVLDECIGSVCACYGISLSLSTAILIFGLFRFFDIVKPLGIKQLEEFPGVWGIILDDIGAAIYTLIIVRCIMYYYPQLLYA